MKSQQSWLFFVPLCLISVMAALWLRGGTDARLFASLDGLATKFHNWLAELEDTHPAGKDFLEVLDISTPCDPFEGTHSPTATGQTFSAMDHAAYDSQVCGRPPTKPRSDTNAQLIYKWVDENGQTHMSDRRPEGCIASVADLDMTKQDFTYEIIPDGVALPIDFQGKLAAGSKRMYDTWHFLLGEEKLRQARILLRLIGGPDRFDA